MIAMGLDRCSAGWVAAWLSHGEANVDFEVLPSVALPVRLARGKLATVVIDLPIGLSDDGSRAVDLAARKFLSPRRASSVFPTPCRPTIAARSYDEACEVESRCRGKKLSKQTFALVPHIRGVDDLIDAEVQVRFREAHPEVIFATLGDRRGGLEHSKKGEPGVRERLSILRPYLPAFDPAAIRKRLGPSQCAIHDIVDAAACLATALRVQRGEAVTLPSENPPTDARGLRMEMVA